METSTVAPPRKPAVRLSARPPTGTSASAVDARLGSPQAPLSVARILALQQAAGNAAVTRLVQSRPGQSRIAQTVQRDPLTDFGFPKPASPLGFGPPNAEQLRFTDRMFAEKSLPTECPRCHRDRPTVPMPERYVDREATEPRLVTWAGESEKMLHTSSSVRSLQLDPGAGNRLVDDYGVGLTKRITASHEFEGSDVLRAAGAETIRRRWSDIRPGVSDRMGTWYEHELMTAVGLTPKLARPILDPAELKRVLTTHHGGVAPLGRWNAIAVPGQRIGVFQITDIGPWQIWFHRPDRPLWMYEIGKGDFIRGHDPFVTAVAEKVYDDTKWILQVTPLLLKVGAFALGFSGSIALVIAGIALEEFATEMQADAEGRPGRSLSEIMTSAGTSLLVDRIFHGLFGGAGKAGKAAAGAGKLGSRIEQVADKAVPVIRKQLAETEAPLVKQALDAGAARKVSDAGLRKEGYLVEVAIDSGGQKHIFRLHERGTWCRFSDRICGVDLGAEVAAAAKSPKSFTQGRLDELGSKLDTIQDEAEFLRTVHAKMKPKGKVDLSVLKPEELAKLSEIIDDPAKLTMRDLIVRPKELGAELARGLDAEARLIAQLYREGKPLYVIMRAASPSFASRSQVLRLAAGRDAATGLLPRSGALAVDHIVPLNEVVRMKGFAELRPERQLEIVNDVRNLRAIDAAANNSRSDWSWADWPRAAIYYGPEQLARMRKLEEELRGYLAGRIAALSRP